MEHAKINRPLTISNCFLTAGITSYFHSFGKKGSVSKLHFFRLLEVLDRLEGIRIYQTKEAGAITIKTDG